jgi:hypothetical protein
MKLLNRISVSEIFDKYDVIIGWGTGPLFRKNCSIDGLECLIDGTEKEVGTKVRNLEVKSKECLKEYSGKILVIIYAIYEREIIEQIKQVVGNKADTIIYSLIDNTAKTGNRVPQINGKSGEDFLLLSLIKQLELTNIQYLEIGVCHPIMRNNTYLLNELFYCNPNYKGVLVEPNPICHSLISEYRPQDKLLKIGASSHDDILEYYMFPGLLGHSTFIKEEAEKKGHKYQVLEIEVKNVNRIIKESFDNYPNLLEIDAEGMDYDIIKELNTALYPIEIIMCEISEKQDNLEALLWEKGYKLFAKTMENGIFLKKDIVIEL